MKKMIKKSTKISKTPFIIIGIFYSLCFLTGLIAIYNLYNKKQNNIEVVPESKNINNDPTPKDNRDQKIDPKKVSKTEGSIPKKVNIKVHKRILARVTVYWAYGSGTDAWSAKRQSSTGARLECGQHAAVDPKVIPYGSKLKLQKNGRPILVKAVDTGGAVKQRKAAIAMAKTPSQRKAPVVDLFFAHKSDALAYANSHPAYQWVDVQLPQRN